MRSSGGSATVPPSRDRRRTRESALKPQVLGRPGAFFVVPRRRGGGTSDDGRSDHRCEHGVGGRGGHPGDVHAGGLRVPRGRPDEDEERRARGREERPHLRHLLPRLLPRRLRLGVRRRGQRVHGRLGLRPLGRRSACDRRGSLLVVLDDPGRRGLPLPGRLRRRLARDRVGSDGRTDEALGVLRLRRLLHGRLLRRLALDLVAGRLAVRARDAGLRGLDGRPLPGSPRSARRSDPARRTYREVRRRRQVEPDPRPQHGVRHARRPRPLVRLVRLQPRLHARAS